MKAIVAAAYMRRAMPFPQLPKLHVETAQHLTHGKWLGRF